MSYACTESANRQIDRPTDGRTKAQSNENDHMESEKFEVAFNNARRRQMG